MTRATIKARNRANAANSTGPRNAAGKAVVAQNARRHGATARPDPERVATWARIILDTPDLEPFDLLVDDAHTRSALALAAAEARLAEATRALQEFEAGDAAPGEVTKDLREMGDAIMEDLIINGGTKREVRSALSILKRIARLEHEETNLGGKRHNLLKRYFWEARAQRKRAFQEWLASRQVQGTSLSTPDKTAKIPKQSQISS